MGLFRRNKNKKNVRRTPDNYTANRMHEDHMATVAAFSVMHPTYVPPTQEEQEREAEAAAEQAEREEAEAFDNDYDNGQDVELEGTPEVRVEESYTAPDTSSNYNSFDSGSSYSSSYDSGSSSYDSGSSSSYDGGGSYDSGSY